MLRHINKNKTWIIIGLAQIYAGIVIILRYQQLDIRLPPFLGVFDDAPVGIAYLIIGFLVVLNFIWDFYWYYIRLVLIVISEMMFLFLFTSYAMSDYVTHSLSFFTGYAFLFAIDVMWTAYMEPPYKLKGGHDA